MKRLQVLLELAKIGAHTEPRDVSSVEIADRLDCSQQTASRWLGKLSEEGLVERESGPKGQTIELTVEGSEFLKSIGREINKIFGDLSENLILRGSLTSGFGEGGYYVSREGYEKQFKEKLGFEPYPGTLDLELQGKYLERKRRLENLEGVIVKGFSTEERKFGSVKCFPARLRESESAIILPSRTHHEEHIVEIISPENIRDEYGLEDGNKIKLEVKI